MWIFDTYYRGCVELWAKEKGLIRKSEAYPPSFYLYLKDPHSHMDMIEALECRCRAEECRFKTIYGPLPGYRIHAGRAVAEMIEKQTGYSAELYNVDVRQDQRYLAEKDLFPCGEADESRFSPDFEVPLSSLQLKVHGNPQRDADPKGIEIIDRHRSRILQGPERTVVSDLLELFRSHDPDVVLMPHADIWVPRIIKRAGKFGLEPAFSRSGRFKRMASRSYWSYGRANHKDGAMIPEGRVLIDTVRSFVYREGGLKGVFMAARLSGLSPNLAARFTPGTLISSYEVYEALRRGIAIPFRKRDAEQLRNISELKSADKGGMIFQPVPGVYDQVHQLDFTSLYPSIIVKHNLSPETLDQPEKQGFLSGAISPLLHLRIETKRRKKTNPEYAGADAVLKWMLVTCFGYTGYRNAKFGQIQVHERITAHSRELLLQIKQMAEDMGLQILHGIVDCLWVQGEAVPGFKEAVERETGILTELDCYDWIAFLPMADGTGAYNRYFGRLDSGKMKIRGVAARRGDTPEYVRHMQQELFQTLASAGSREALFEIEPEARAIRRKYFEGLESADMRDLAIHRRVGRQNYTRRCAEAAAVEACRRSGLHPAPGMEIGYVVKDARRWSVETEDLAEEFDPGYYTGLLQKAWQEVAFVWQLSGGAKAEIKLQL